MADLNLRGGFDFDVLGFDECGSPPSRKIAFLGSVKCFFISAVKSTIRNPEVEEKREEKNESALLEERSVKP